MLDWVLAGQLDIAIVNAPARETSLAARHILDEEMMVACRAGRKLMLPRIVPFRSRGMPAGFEGCKVIDPGDWS
jgi:DNA-binding transcriptional LysR family regulator